jgi:hypothetical protein
MTLLRYRLLNTSIRIHLLTNISPRLDPVNHPIVTIELVLSIGRNDPDKETMHWTHVVSIFKGKSNMLEIKGSEVGEYGWPNLGRDLRII